MTTFKIPQDRLAKLTHEFEKLARRATKLGVAVPTMTLVGDPIHEMKKKASGDEPAVFVKYQMVEVEGEPPHVAGYTFVAKLSFEQSRPTVFTAPDQTLPVEYRDADPKVCDHCKARRFRKNVFVVRGENGDHMQIGRNCLSDFLGGRDPKIVAQSMTYLQSFFGEAEDAADEDRDYRGIQIEEHYPIDFILTLSSAVIRRDGWVSVGAARAYNEAVDNNWDDSDPDATDTRRYKTPTKWEVARQIHPDYHSQERDFVKVETDEKDNERAAATIDLINTIWAAKDGPSDYEYNMVVAFGDGYCTYKLLGIVVSAISAYQRHAEVEIEKAARIEKIEASNFKHVGVVGERCPFTVTVTSEKFLENNFGVSFLYTFTDPDGNELKWFASREQDMDVGETYNIVANVTRHDIWEDMPQTRINRAIVQ